jgi:hypothetical protein
MPSLSFSFALHDELIALADRIALSRTFFRKPARPTRAVAGSETASKRPLVDRDRHMCGLAIKARKTSEAVRHLCEMRFGEDAMALARVALENAVVMAWLIRGPARERLDTFCLAAAPARNRWLEILALYYKDEPGVLERVANLRDADVDTIATALFDDSHTTWAYFPNAKGKLAPVSAKEMFLGANDERPETVFAYDAVYFDTSAYVHSGPASLRAINDRLESSEIFIVPSENSPDELCERAMGVTIVALALALAALDEYAGLGIDSSVQDIRARMSPSAAGGSPSTT